MLRRAELDAVLASNNASTSESSLARLTRDLTARAKAYSEEQASLQIAFETQTTALAIAREDEKKERAERDQAEKEVQEIKDALKRITNGLDVIQAVDSFLDCHRSATMALVSVRDPSTAPTSITLAHLESDAFQLARACTTKDAPKTTTAANPRVCSDELRQLPSNIDSSVTTLLQALDNAVAVANPTCQTLRERTTQRMVHAASGKPPDPAEWLGDVPQLKQLVFPTQPSTGAPSANDKVLLARRDAETEQKQTQVQRTKDLLTKTKAHEQAKQNISAALETIKTIEVTRQKITEDKAQVAAKQKKVDAHLVIAKAAPKILNAPAECASKHCRCIASVLPCDCPAPPFKIPGSNK